jgi:hypothetical protein
MLTELIANLPEVIDQMHNRDDIVTLMICGSNALSITHNLELFSITQNFVTQSGRFVTW